MLKYLLAAFLALIPIANAQAPSSTWGPYVVNPFITYPISTGATYSVLALNSYYTNIVWRSATASTKSLSIKGCATANLGYVVRVLDKQNTATTYPITVTPTTGTINGSATATISMNRGSLDLICDAANTDWVSPVSVGLTSITGNNGLTATPNPITGVGTIGLTTIADQRVMGNVSGGTTYATGLTATQLTTLVNPFTASLKGAVNAPVTATGKFLKDDNTWDTPTNTTYSAGTGLTLTSTTFSVKACLVSPFIAYTNCTQTWSAAQAGDIQTVTISTATFTPNFDTNQNFKLTLSSACPCTLANPSTTLVPGQSGIIEIIQDGTGSRTIGTWGSKYLYPGGTSTITLSTTASAKDRIAYYISDTSSIVLGAPVLNATH